MGQGTAAGVPGAPQGRRCDAPKAPGSPKLMFNVFELDKEAEGAMTVARRGERRPGKGRARGPNGGSLGSEEELSGVLRVAHARAPEQEAGRGSRLKKGSCTDDEDRQAAAASDAGEDASVCWQRQEKLKGRPGAWSRASSCLPRIAPERPQPLHVAVSQPRGHMRSASESAVVSFEEAYRLASSTPSSGEDRNDSSGESYEDRQGHEEAAPAVAECAPRGAVEPRGMTREETAESMGSGSLVVEAFLSQLDTQGKEEAARGEDETHSRLPLASVPAAQHGLGEVEALHGSQQGPLSRLSGGTDQAGPLAKAETVTPGKCTVEYSLNTMREGAVEPTSGRRPGGRRISREWDADTEDGQEPEGGASNQEPNPDDWKASVTELFLRRAIVLPNVPGPH